MAHCPPFISLNSSQHDVTDEGTQYTNDSSISQSSTPTAHNSCRYLPIYQHSISAAVSTEQLLELPKPPPTQKSTIPYQPTSLSSDIQCLAAMPDFSVNIGDAQRLGDHLSDNCYKSGPSSLSVNSHGLGSRITWHLYTMNPESGFVLFPHETESDDALHQPDGKEAREYDIFTKRGALNVGGLVFIVVCILALFVVYPVVAFT
ncbi:hypothetical protein BDZ91DRAFT_794460 [Kalaharituber pfeilii]|nr:hypothetical protein BDZ91DRAFT_794460 [Kalaharituber pfeilii]